MATHHHIAQDLGGRPRASASRYEQNVAIYPLDYDETEYSKRPLYDPRRRRVSLTDQEHFSRRVRDKFWFLRKYTRAPQTEPKSVALQTRAQLGEERRAGRDRLSLMLAENSMMRPNYLTQAYLKPRKGDLNGSIAVAPLSKSSEFPALEVAPLADAELQSIVNSHKLRLLREADGEGNGSDVVGENSSSSNDGGDASWPTLSDPKLDSDDKDLDHSDLLRLENKQALFFLHATTSFETSEDDVREYFRRLLSREMKVDETTTNVEVSTLKPQEFLVAVKDELQYGHVARVERRRYNRIQNEAASILPSEHSSVDPLELAETSMYYGWGKLRNDTEQVEERRLATLDWSAQDVTRFDLRRSQVDYAAKLLQHIQGLGVPLDKADTDVLLFGTVQQYVIDKGYGFITIDQHTRIPRAMANRDSLRPGEQIFFHQNDVLGEDGKPVDRRGKNRDAAETVFISSEKSDTPDKVMFRVGLDKKDKWRATEIRHNFTESDFKKAIEEAGLSLDLGGEQDNFGTENQEFGDNDLMSLYGDDNLDDIDESVAATKKDSKLSSTTDSHSDPWQLQSQSPSSTSDLASSFSSLPPQASKAPRETYPAQVEVPLHSPNVHSPTGAPAAGGPAMQQQPLSQDAGAVDYAATPQQYHSPYATPPSFQYEQQPPHYQQVQYPQQQQQQQPPYVPTYPTYVQQQPPTGFAGDFVHQQQPMPMPWDAPYHAQQGLPVYNGFPVAVGGAMDHTYPQQVSYSAAQAATSHNLRAANAIPPHEGFPEYIELTNFMHRQAVNGTWRLSPPRAHYNDVPYYQKDDGKLYMFYAEHSVEEHNASKLWYVSEQLGEREKLVVCSVADYNFFLPSASRWVEYDGANYVTVPEAVRVLNAGGNQGGHHQAPPIAQRWFSTDNGARASGSSSATNTSLTGLHHAAPLLHSSRSHVQTMSRSLSRRRPLHTAASLSSKGSSKTRIQTHVRQTFRLMMRAAR